ncbi:hypothetical protein Tco_0626620 [Tanacetum coccineum]|uniref:Uncharacterized protein n=1 Tax=Tanacetum coccineum TaxID=301880 RepID=A0ABQ4WKD4_9ASTR
MNPPLSRFNTLGSGEDRRKLKKLMELFTKLSARVLDLETTKTTQAKEIANLQKRVKKLERKRKSRTPGMNIFKIDSDLIEEIDANMDEAIEHVYDANKDIVEEGEVQVHTADMEVNTARTESVIYSATEPSTHANNNKYTMKKKDLTICSDPCEDEKLQAQMQAEQEEEERLAKKREEDANIAEWDDVQAMMDADYELTCKIC